MNNYLKILGFQLELDLKSTGRREFVLENEKYKKQMEETFILINEYNPDLVIYPELVYTDFYYSNFLELSKGRLIVAGSVYRDSINTSIVFQNEEVFEIPKLYASNQEPMVRFIDKLDYRIALKMFDDHIFYINKRKIVLLNCMEYYNLAYYLAREDNDIFALVSPCCNNKMNLFKMETQAIHNHNDNIYSIVVNSVGTYNEESFSTGDSYVYGPIQKMESKWLQEEGVINDKHNSSILNLKGSSYFYGEFTNNLKRFGRSDDYINNPRKVKVKTIDFN